MFYRLRGDKELSESDNIIIKKDVENVTYSLTLKDLKASDSSKYSCKAVNEYGEAKETAELIVKGKKLSGILSITSINQSSLNHGNRFKESIRKNVAHYSSPNS